MAKSKFKNSIFAIVNVVLIGSTMIISSIFTQSYNALVKEIMHIASMFKELL